MKHRGFLTCFVGVDGSGKTTQAKLLVNWLESQGIESAYVWSRGEVRAVRSILLFMGRSALGTSTRTIAKDKKSYSEYQSRKARLLENPVVRMLWSAMTHVEHVTQINLEIRQRIRDGKVLVCDRYLWDSSIDLAVLNNRTPEWLSGGLNTLMWKLVPKPTLTFYIDVPPEEALKRKNDIPSLDYVTKRAAFYRHLASCNSWTVIDGREEVAAIHAKIKGLVKNHIAK